MCFMPKAPAAPKSDPVSVSVPTTPANTGVNDGAQGNNSVTTAKDGYVAPAEELNQAAPQKKAENTSSANTLAIGTKKYRAGGTGLGLSSQAR